jgi:hypothetical protein
MVADMPALISLTNSISCLRGNLPAYYQAREIDADDQKYYYLCENESEKKVA